MARRTKYNIKTTSRTYILVGTLSKTHKDFT